MLTFEILLGYNNCPRIKNLIDYNLHYLSFYKNDFKHNPLYIEFLCYTMNLSLGQELIWGHGFNNLELK